MTKRATASHEPVAADPSGAIREAVHDIRNRIGVVRLGIGAALDDEATAYAPQALLERAEEETVRIFSELGSIEAFVACPDEGVPLEPTEIAAVLRAAASEAAGLGLGVRVQGDAGRVWARPAAMRVALPALMLVASGGDHAVTATMDGARVRIAADTGHQVEPGAIEHALVDRMGASALPGVPGIAFEFRDAAAT